MASCAEEKSYGTQDRLGDLKFGNSPWKLDIQKFIPVVWCPQNVEYPKASKVQASLHLPTSLLTSFCSRLRQQVEARVVGESRTRLRGYRRRQ